MELIEIKILPHDITPHLNQAISVAGVWKLDNYWGGRNKENPRHAMKSNSSFVRLAASAASSSRMCLPFKEECEDVGQSAAGSNWGGDRMRACYEQSVTSVRPTQVKWIKSARWGSGAGIDALLFSARRHRREQQLGRYKALQLCSGRGTRLDEQLRCSPYIRPIY
jgi:hypothetical protein